MVACSGSASEHTASSPSAATDDVYQTLSLADTASPQQVLISPYYYCFCACLNYLHQSAVVAVVKSETLDQFLNGNI